MLRSKYLLTKLAIFFCLLIFIIPSSIGGELSKPLSLQETIETVEVKTFNQKYGEDPLIIRIERLEKLIWNVKQSGSLIERVEKIKKYSEKMKDLKPDRDNNVKPTGSDVQVPGLIQEFPEGLVPNDDKQDNDTQSNNTGSSVSDTSQNTDNTVKENKKKNKKQKKEKKQKVIEKEPEFDPNAPNYYDVLMYVNQNRVIRWSKMPIKIFIPEGSNITYFPEYRECLIRALDDWKTKSGGKIDYVIVNKAKKANIKVIWQDIFPETASDAGTSSYSAGYNLNQNVAGNIISTASGFIPGAFGLGASLLGSLVGNMNNTVPRIKDVYLRIGTLPAMKISKEKALAYIQSVASHQYGHAIGVNCHSNNPDDVMYPEVSIDIETAKSPSARDINTAIELYSHDAYITE